MSGTFIRLFSLRVTPTQRITITFHAVGSMGLVITLAGISNDYVAENYTLRATLSALATRAQ